jgi:hypothetical protein
MKTIEVFTQMNELWNAFNENHAKFIEKGNKSAGGKARKSIGDLKKLVTEYRKVSVLESKS